MLNKKILAAGAILLLAQVSSFAADSFLGADSVSGEFGTGNKSKLARVGLQYDWGKQWLQYNGMHVGGYWDVTLAQWHNTAYKGVADATQNITDIGVTPVFRLESDSKKGFYGEAAIGFHLMSHVYNNNGRPFSTAFQFGDHIGVGYVFNNGWDVALKAQHFSNGGIKHPNPGANLAVLKVGHSF
ncbi:acyloxyacyl hydrolase [Undibacterium terreum]|uniref:Lipid A deacylase n=1 Tax=Undibacterium terreum TaxID=1224302 RepID=A0A916UPD7_9BURK|nr:acyloxyacyl hydrolase [Undibacterium terreum]GGC80240.1 lipid A deacylase [Undibacterium terreum]